MENTRINKILLCIAGVVFLLCFICQAWAYWWTRNYFGAPIFTLPVLIQCSFILVPIGILTERKKIAGVGFAICTLYQLYALSTLSSSADSYRIIVCLGILIWMAFGAISCFTNGRISAVFAIISVLLALFVVATVFTHGFTKYDFAKQWKMFVRYSNTANLMQEFGVRLIAAVGFVFLAISNLKFVKKEKANTVSASATSNKVTRLSNLKNLLDQGIISQEDFDKKKQEIINS